MMLVLRVDAIYSFQPRNRVYECVNVKMRVCKNARTLVNIRIYVICILHAYASLVINDNQNVREMAIPWTVNAYSLVFETSVALV